MSGGGLNGGKKICYRTYHLIKKKVLFKETNLEILEIFYRTNFIFVQFILCYKFDFTIGLFNCQIAKMKYFKQLIYVTGLKRIEKKMLTGVICNPLALFVKFMFR